MGIRWLTPQPKHFGLVNGQLRSCPDQPNCVCSHSENELHAIDPIQYQGESEIARKILLDIVESRADLRLIEATDVYLRVEARTRWLGFIDDIEFLVDPEASQIHIRSASRLGYSDLGANRARIETIRKLFQQRQDSP